MEKKRENQVVTSEEFRADPGGIVDRAKAGPVTVMAADGKSKSVVIAIPRVDDQGRVTLK